MKNTEKLRAAFSTLPRSPEGEPLLTAAAAADLTGVGVHAFHRMEYRSRIKPIVLLGTTKLYSALAIATELENPRRPGRKPKAHRHE